MPSLVRFPEKNVATIRAWWRVLKNIFLAQELLSSKLSEPFLFSRTSGTLSLDASFLFPTKTRINKLSSQPNTKQQWGIMPHYVIILTITTATLIIYNLAYLCPVLLLVIRVFQRLPIPIVFHTMLLNNFFFCILFVILPSSFFCFPIKFEQNIISFVKVKALLDH